MWITHTGQTRKWTDELGLSPVLFQLPSQKVHAAFELVKAIDTVFDTDPAVEADGLQ